LDVACCMTINVHNLAWVPLRFPLDNHFGLTVMYTICFMNIVYNVTGICCSIQITDS